MTTTAPYAIMFDGSEAADASSYQFAVDGSVTAATYRNAPIDDADLINGTTVDGDVTDGYVGLYHFKDNIDDFRLLSQQTEVDLEYDVDS